MLGLSVVRFAVRLVGAMTFVGLLSSCAASPKAAEPQAGPAGTTSIKAPIQSAPAATAAAPTPKLLNFTAPKLGGGQVVGSELAGKDVAMFFWAPW